LRNIPPQTLAAIQTHFHTLIRKRASDFVGEYNGVLPELTSLLLSGEESDWFAVDGMYGGFRYELQGEGDETKLLCSSWSRVVGGSGQRHEINAGNCKLVEQGFV
jgi:hypothetical protein